MCFDVDVRVRRGERVVGAVFRTGPGITALLGPSGAGKTSVLDMIAGLLRPDEGRVIVAGETLFDSGQRLDVAAHRRRAGYVFQEARLFPHLRVRANLRYGKNAADEREIARLLEIDGLLDRWPRTLSGGEARRVAIARALLSRPRFLLLDEPLSSLDPARKEDATRLIGRVHGETGLPILLVTHDERDADRLGGEVVRM